MKLIQVGSDVIDQVAGNLAVQLVAIHQPSRDVARFQRIDIDYRKQLCPGFDGFTRAGDQNDLQRRTRHILQLGQNFNASLRQLLCIGLIAGARARPIASGRSIFNGLLNRCSWSCIEAR